MAKNKLPLSIKSKVKKALDDNPSLEYVPLQLTPSEAAQLNSNKYGQFKDGKSVKASLKRLLSLRGHDCPKSFEYKPSEMLINIVNR